LDLAAAAAGLTKTPIVSIDCSQQDADDDLCKRYDINAYPTIRLFRKGESEEKNHDGHTRNNSTWTRYRGARTASA
jgi:lipopolysaccharide export LptBFGC system permease protein LptF